MAEADLWDALRRHGHDADDPDVRASVRAALDAVAAVRDQAGPHAARRCTEAVQEAMAFELRHPDTRDMSRFEDEFDDEAP